MNRISACLIVKDEAELLPDCLASLQSFVDEVRRSSLLRRGRAWSIILGAATSLRRAMPRSPWRATRGFW
jgi:hypothetical protein